MSTKSFCERDNVVIEPQSFPLRDDKLKKIVELGDCCFHMNEEEFRQIFGFIKADIVLMAFPCPDNDGRLVVLGKDGMVSKKTLMKWFDHIARGEKPKGNIVVNVAKIEDRYKVLGVSVKKV